MAIRIAKLALMVAAGLFALLIGYNNVVDYDSNFAFVQHVLTMDTTFPDNAVRASRSIQDPALHQAFYAAIIGLTDILYQVE